MRKKVPLEYWSVAAQKWEARRIAKRITAWEACGLELWTALHEATVKLEAMERALGFVLDDFDDGDSPCLSVRTVQTVLSIRKLIATAQEEQRE